MKRRALITGISGQDGSYLTELLLEKDYQVFGIVRRNSVTEHEEMRLRDILQRVEIEYGDLLDVSSLYRVLQLVKPHEIYNLAAQSHVGISFQVPSYTVQTNALGAFNLLEAYGAAAAGVRFYQAGSSEMFGNSIDSDECQRESTVMAPVSPYGCAKLFAYNITRHYRSAHRLFAVNGILFNHESPRRASNFVTAKIVKTAVQIRRGLSDRLVLGNLNAYRDWGHAKDYVRAMWMMVNHREPDDFVIATGASYSVRDVCEYVFGRLGMDYREYVVQDEQFTRPDELNYLRGDASKANRVLGWAPTYTFSALLDELIAHWEQILEGRPASETSVGNCPRYFPSLPR